MKTKTILEYFGAGIIGIGALSLCSFLFLPFYFPEQFGQPINLTNSSFSLPFAYMDCFKGNIRIYEWQVPINNGIQQQSKEAYYLLPTNSSDYKSELFRFEAIYGGKILCGSSSTNP
jgi:hypothetical protein